MNVTLYSNKSDIRVLNKNLSLLGTVTAQFNQEVSIEDPILILDAKDNYINANYVYIEKFARYYIVTDKRVLDGGRIEITCHVDVLMSFKNAIYNAQIIAERSGSNPDVFVTDDVVTVRDSITTYVRNVKVNAFPGLTAGNNYVLTIGGK